MIFLLWQPFLINWWAKCLFWYKHLWTAIQKYHADQSHSDQVGFDWSMRRCNWLVGMKSCMWLVGMIFLVAIYKCLSFHSLTSLLVSRTGSASDWCAQWEELYKCIDTIQHIHTYIQTYIHTYIQTYIQTYIGVLKQFFKPNFGRWNWF